MENTNIKNVLAEEQNECSKKSMNVNEQMSHIKTHVENEKKAAMIKQMNELLDLMNTDRNLPDILMKIKDFLEIKVERWLTKHESHSVEQFFDKIKCEFEKCKTETDFDDLSPTGVIEKASGGLLLRGTFLSRTAKIDKIGKPLVKIKDTANIDFRSPHIAEFDCTYDYESSDQKRTFYKNLHTFGVRTAVKCSVDSSTGLFSTDVGTYLCTDCEIEKSDRRYKTMIGRMSCFVVPVASLHSEISMFKVSTDAFVDLQEIHVFFLNNEIDKAEQKCLHFFESYGSHFTVGDVHFGGIYMCEAEYVSENESEKEDIKQMVQSKFSKSFLAKGENFGIGCWNIDASADGSAAFVDTNGEYEERETNTVMVSERKVGGPIGINVLSLWKKGLHACNHTWAVIDRDKLFSIGVWILVMSHKYGFKDATKFAQFLRDVWKKNTGIKTADSIQDEILFRSRCQMQISIMEKLKKVENDQTPSTYLMILKELLEEVETCENDMGDNSVWKMELEENPYIEKIIRMMVKLEIFDPDDTELKRVVRRLLEKGNNPTFANCVEVWMWLDGKQVSEEYETLSIIPLNTIEDLLTAIESGYLKNRGLKFEEKKHAVSQIETKIAIEVANAITQLRNVLRKNDHYHYLMLIALIVPLQFDMEHCVIRQKMTMKILENFVSQSKCVMAEYTKLNFNNVMKTEAWLFQRILRNANDSGMSQEYVSEVFSHMKKQNLPVDQKIGQLIFERDDRDLNTLLNSLTLCLEEEPKETEKKMIGWDYFENNSEPFNNCIKGTKKFQKNMENVLHDKDSEITNQLLSILDTLDLRQYFPDKLTKSSVSAITDKMFDDAAEIADIPLVILRKIISVNTDFREKVLVDFVQQEVVYDLLDVSSQKSVSELEDHELHPIDVFMTVFCCCDPFLKRIIIEKMAMCQLAIPLVYKNFVQNKIILSLWPIRQIYLHGSSKSIVDQKLKVVSFLRIGNKSLKSKSRLINQIIRDNEHHTFFHRDCPLGGMRRKLSNGLIEMSWYAAAKSSDERKSKKIDDRNIAQEPFVIFNLRGDASEYKAQTNILLENTSVFVILINRESLIDSRYLEIMKTLHQSNAVVILVSGIQSLNDFQSFQESYEHETQMQREKTKIISTFNIHNKTDRNESEFLGVMRRSIHDALEQSGKKIGLADIVKNDFVESDENSTKCTDARRLSEKVFETKTELDNTVDRKSTFLPLQGETLWHKWSKLQKDQNRIGNNIANEGQNDKTMKDIRKEQIESCNKAPKPMALFCEILIQNIHDDEKVLFFIDWLKVNLENQSSVVIHELRQKFVEEYKRCEESTSLPNFSSLKLKSALEDVDRKLANALFGLEHFFREMGQIFESFMYCRDDLSFSIKDKTMHILQNLPFVAAKLLLLGQPLEIMDGDASNVPLKWLKAVFKNIEHLLDKSEGYHKLFSISVLGIQSSGKSTLLNTMFGLQFPACAGRCTRGIFLQLVQVDRDRSSLPFDYVMVIDTEGLRAPELAGEKIPHDNELATLVIGLADIAIINIQGETLADMQDILQIVVHGLMKLKQANSKIDLSKTGIFIHQNVSARDAKERMMQSNQKIVDYLDKITVEIAEQSNISGVCSFRDVIEFNPLDNVKYFPDLWHGSPPMAPVSNTYSTEVTSLAKLITSDILKKKKRYHSVSNTFLHIESLWNGILAEDFVFSFRNCVEIKAYSLLEDEYQQNLFALEIFKLDWWNENVDFRLNICNSETAVEETSRDLKADFILKIAEESNRLDNKLTKFANESELNVHMINWIQGKKGNLKTKTESLRGGVIGKIDHEKKRRIFRQGEETRRCNFEKHINKKAKELANNLKGKKAEDETMKLKFDHLWTQLFTEIVENSNDETPAAKKENIHKWMKMKLYETYSSHKTLLDKALQEKSLSCEMETDIIESNFKIECSFKIESIGDHDIKPTTLYQRAKDKSDRFGRKSTQFIQQAHGLSQKILSSINSYLRDLLKKDVEIDETHYSVVLKTINSTFHKHNADLKEFHLAQELLIKIVLHASRFSLNVFLKHNLEYQAKSSLEHHIVAFKPRAWTYFSNICAAKAEEIVAGNLLCETIESMIRRKIEKEIPGIIVLKMKKKFNNRKHKLMISILEELAEIDDFDEFIRFIKSPSDYALDWLIKQTNDNFFGRESHKYLKYTRKRIERLIKDVKDTISEIEQETRVTSMKEWMKIFFMLAEEKKLVPSYSFKHVFECDVKDFKDFQTVIFEQLDNVQEKLTNEFADQNADGIKWEYETPYMEIFQLWGCTESCPWCGEPCQDSDPDHWRCSDHQCIQHRPEGIGGTRDRETHEMEIRDCSFKVQSKFDISCGRWCKCRDKSCTKSHPYRSYQKYMKKWYIAPSANLSKVGYWNWVFAKHNERFARHYDSKQPESIPYSWKIMSKEAAVSSLREPM